MNKSIGHCSLTRLLCALVFATAMSLVLAACPSAGTTDAPSAVTTVTIPVDGDRSTILRINGMVAVGDRVSNATVRVVCGTYDSKQNIGYTTVSSGGGTLDGDVAGVYTITIEEREYINDCRTGGIRAQADFRLAADGEESRQLFSGTAGFDGAQLTLNINPFTDVGVRTALPETDAVWLPAQPSDDDWQAIAANIEVLVDITDSTADFATGQFDQQMDDTLERYRIEPSPEANAVRFMVAKPNGVPDSTEAPPAVVELSVENGALRTPARAQMREIAKIREIAALIAVEDYSQRVADNLDQFNTQISEITETEEIIEFVAISSNVPKKLSLVELGLDEEADAKWRIQSVSGAGINAYLIGTEEIGLEIERTMRNKRHFKVVFTDMKGGLREQFYTIVILAEPEIAPISINAHEQGETIFSPQIDDPDGLIDSYELRGAPNFVLLDPVSGTVRILPDYGAVATGTSKDYEFALLARQNDDTLGDRTITTPVILSIANTQAPESTQSPIADTIMGTEDTPRTLLRHELLETSQGAIWQIVGATAETGSMLRIEHASDRITATLPNAIGTQRFSVLFRADAITVEHEYLLEVQQRDDVQITPIDSTISSGSRVELLISVLDPDSELQGDETAVLQGNPEYVRLDWANRKLIVEPSDAVHESSRFVLNIDYSGQHIQGTIALTVVDDAPPGEVSELTVDVGERSATLRWLDPDSTDLASIKIEPSGSAAPITVRTGRGEYRLECLSSGVEGIRIYTVDARGNPSSGTPYQIRFAADASSTRKGAIALAIDSTTCGNIATEADRDWYKAHLTQGRLYRIAMDKQPSSHVDPIVRLFPKLDKNTFIADNNGANPGTNLSNALLYYRATRTGIHDIQVTTATADRDVNNIDYIGDYSVSIRETSDLPDSSTQMPLLASGQSLTRDIADYELVWSDEFNSVPLDDTMWDHAAYFPGTTDRRSLAGPRDENDIRQSEYWQINTEATLRLTSHDGLQVLRQAITYPRYSGLRGQPGWDIDDDGNWRILRPDDTPILISDGYLPTISDTNFGPLPDLGNIAGSATGFWGSRISGKHKIHTRYGYYELYVRYTDFLDFPGFRFAWWMDGQNYWAESGNERDSLRNSVFNGMEIDIAEVQSEDGKFTKLKDWSVLHINSNPRVRAYRVKVRNINNSVDQNRWHRLGIEWTPTDICIYRDGRKDSCASNICTSCASPFQNWSTFEITRRSNPIISHRPGWMIINQIAGGWEGESIIPDHHERMKNLDAAVYVDYVRMYKPRDRYGDLEPDNHLFRNDGNSVNSEADLQVRP